MTDAKTNGYSEIVVKNNNNEEGNNVDIEPEKEPKMAESLPATAPVPDSM